MTIIQYILKDIKTPGSYVPTGIAVGLAVCLLANLINRFFVIHNRNRDGEMNSAADKESIHPSTPCCITFSAYRNIPIFLIALYIYAILQHSFFLRPPSSRTAVNLILFGTWGKAHSRKHRSLKICSYLSLMLYCSPCL